MHRTKKIASDFNLETNQIISKYVFAGFTQRFVRDNIKTFKEEKRCFNNITVVI